jgi:hypothetical protein
MGADRLVAAGGVISVRRERDQASSACDGRHGTGTVTTTDGTEIFYKDWGSGQPIVFSHGWPLSADDWDNQMLFFLG